jgi:hypothetical protein
VTADTPKRDNYGKPDNHPGRDSLQPLFASGSIKANKTDDRLSKLERTSAVRFVNVHYMMNSKTPVKGVLGITNKGRTIDAYFFPGTSDKKAMIIGGMHGSELSSIAVAYEVIARLATTGQLYYNVLVIPMLYPDNAETAQLNPLHTGNFFNIGRYSNRTAIDPNRQMPTPGKPFDPAVSVDHLGRKIERENQLLLNAIQEFLPERIINIHAIRDTQYAGIYADPRTDCRGYALGYARDEALALKMAKLISTRGGSVPGNKLFDSPTTVYYKDPPPVEAGKLQPRSNGITKMRFQRGNGISLGSWATTEVCNVDSRKRRAAISLITVEFPGYKAPEMYFSKTEQNNCSKNVNLYAQAIYDVFLSEHEQLEAND